MTREMIYISKDIKYLWGLDLSMSNSGIVIFNIDTFEPVHITSIKTNDKQEHGERLHTQREFVKELINKYPPYEVAIEKGFTRFNNATQTIYRVVGVFNEILHKYNQYYYAATTIKKLVGGNGKASKELVQKSILKKYPNIEFDNEDQSDAFGVCISHLIKKYKMKW